MFKAMERIELKDFYNEGFGWVCKHCERLPAPGSEKRRLLAEGESEGKEPALSSRAMARWADKEQRTLVCPSCGITEPVEKY